VAVSVRRLLAVVLTAAAEAAAIALVVSGPRESLAFDVRLPLLVVAVAAVLTVTARRHGRIGLPTGWITSPPPPVPMATPWLILSGTAGIAILTVKAYEIDPAVIGGVLGGIGAFCLLVSGACLIQWLRLPADGAELVGEG
jgi:hypothetical protein